MKERGEHFKVDTVARVCAPLSAQELHIAREFCRGLTRKEIAFKMNRSVKTVCTHLERIARKTGTTNAVSLLAWMLKKEKITLSELPDGAPVCWCKCPCHTFNP